MIFEDKYIYILCVSEHILDTTLVTLFSLSSLSSLFTLYVPYPLFFLYLFIYLSLSLNSLSYFRLYSTFPFLSHSLSQLTHLYLTLSLSTLSSLSPPLSIEEDNNEIPRIESHTWNGSNVQGWKTPFYSLSPLSACPLYQ